MIGISTGGPQALSLTLPLVAVPTPPILVVQHMPAQFTGVFARRLDRSCSVRVKEAAEGDPVLPNQILIAPGGRHMMLAGTAPRVRVTILDDDPVSGHKPSVDVLFQSAARIYQSSAVGILMTGMGRDGVEGCKAILTAGGFTLGQDEATSVVYGMNKAPSSRRPSRPSSPSMSWLALSITSRPIARNMTRAHEPTTRPVLLDGLTPVD